MNKDSIAIVSISTFPYYKDGQASVINSLTEGLLKANKDVHIITILPPKQDKKVDEFNGVKYHYLPIPADIRTDGERMLYTRDGYLNKEAEKDFENILNEIKPNIVNFHSIDGMGVNLIEKTKEMGFKAVINIHDYSWLCPNPFLIKDNGFPYKKKVIDYVEWSRAIGGREELIREKTGESIPEFIKSKFDYLKKVLLSSDLIIFPSHYIADDYKANGISEDKCLVITNPVREIKEKYKLKKEGTLIFGHLAGYGGRGKGVDVAVEAFKKLSPNVDARLEVLACIGVEWNLNFGKLFGLIKFITAPFYIIKESYKWFKFSKDIIIRNNRPGKITYWPKFPPEDVDKILTRLDCLIVPSIYRESFSLTTAEALSFGIPVIASNKGGMVDLINNGVNGLLFEQGDEGDLKDKVAMIANDRELFEKLVKGASKFKSLDSVQYGEAFVEAINKLS